MTEWLNDAARAAARRPNSAAYLAWEASAHDDVGVADPQELAAVQRVWQRANTARGKVPGAQRIARVAAKLREPDALVIVARQDGGITGMALAEPGRDHDGAVEPDLCHISMVFVDPDNWGSGIGRLLLDAVARHASSRSHTLLQLWTGTENHRARRLYERAGFRPTGRVQQLDSGEEVIHLVRTLPAGYRS